MEDKIPFTQPYFVGDETQKISDVLRSRNLAGDGLLTKRCQKLIRELCSSNFALVTNSCTAALEMSALLAGITEGDEVIMPSFTFSSTANAFVLRGATPVFVDIRADTLNIDEAKIEEAISNKTKAIVPVHYAGVSCAMNEIMEISDKASLLVIEDAAQGLLSTYDSKPLGAFGSFGCLSFHATKNIIAGEGGALLVRDENCLLNAEMIREKGTDRSQFLRGEVDKYTWRTVGSSYLASEITSALLLSQLTSAQFITSERKKIWNYYYQETEFLEKSGVLRRPSIPEKCAHNAHIFYLVLENHLNRDRIIEYMRDRNIQATSHYTPLHNSPAGVKFGRNAGSLDNTVKTSSQIIRLPLWVGLSKQHMDRVLAALFDAVNKKYKN